jgi:hypothetical protein
MIRLMAGMEMIRWQVDWALMSLMAGREVTPYY